MAVIKVTSMSHVPAGCHGSDQGDQHVVCPGPAACMSYVPAGCHGIDQGDQHVVLSALNT
jgi:hypothetical protein